jgi:hypothetical protein
MSTGEEMSGLFGQRTVRYACRLVLAITILALCAACGGSVQPEVTYKPPLLPVELSLGPSGFSVKGDATLATVIGDFSIGAKYDLPTRETGGIYVILRDRKTGYDKIFEIRTGNDQVSAVVNGTTTITVTKDQVLIDVTNGTIKSVQFKRTSSTGVTEASSSGWITANRHKAAARWDEGWRESWYHPLQLAKWAYGDSTIEKWYGVGFVWFLLRLLFAIVLFLVDAILTVGFVVGQAAFLLFGPTGRDASYGLMILIVIISGFALASAEL